MVNSPSMVPITPQPNFWSSATSVRHTLGYFRLGLAMSSSYDVLAGAEPVGRFALGLALNINSLFCAAVFVAAPLTTVYEPNSTPLFDAWFDIHTKGTVPANKPVPPRTWVD